MRTTITLSDEATSLLQRSMDKHGYTFREAVNQAIVAGLDSREVPYPDAPSFASGSPHISLVKANALSDQISDEEIIRKMAVGR